MSALDIITHNLNPRHMSQRHRELINDKYVFINYY